MMHIRDEEERQMITCQLMLAIWSICFNCWICTHFWLDMPWCGW